MKKLMVTAAAVAVIGLGGFFVATAMASPETKIRWRLEEMAEDFNLARPGPLSRGLADDFREETAGVGKQDIRAFVTQMTFTERDKETKKFLHRVTLPEEEMSIEVDPADSTKAHVDLVATFEKLRKGSWDLSWRVSIDADLVDGDDGWQVLRATHETLEGDGFR